ncbi:unnamed protein product [Adineta ricciae]|uniref:ascorbate ferrireductase (transmembrane) n=1 Tax=Adineta ricciae TaxID=249248 RepID=A0A813MY06_ADIRI|nr:unnamed protein product [Adineta ricciae]
MLKHLPIFLLLLTTVHAQQFQWILLTDGTSMDTPEARRDAALGFDQTFLILYGGRTQTGRPTQDSYAFNLQTGQWDTLTFPSPPPSRYGMASASSINGGLYIFGGFGTEGSSVYYNPYLSLGANQQTPNYNYATPPNFVQNPVLMNNPDFINNPNYNPLSGTGYNKVDNYVNNDDRSDENYYPLQDAWFLSYASKTWLQTQTSQYARGFGSAAASPYATTAPKVLYTMGKSRVGMYSIVETIGEGTSGLSQTGTTQSAIIMYDMPSLSPAYPHARYGHSTTLLTDNHLLLFGGCLSGYGKGGPCPSKDTWLLQIDRGHWERLGECPTTKTGAAMVTLPSYSICASMGQSAADAAANINAGVDQPVAVLWSGRETNPSSIVTYPSPRDEIAVFSLNQKEWYLKRAAPSPTDGSYPMQREGAAVVAGCFQGAPGMFVFGGRATADRRMLSDLWFLQASPQDALSAPGTRSCIYPFSFYHLHGVFQFLTYGIVFPAGYLVGRHGTNLSIRRPLHMILQLSGVALAICGFAFGVHSVRAPAWLHFRHPHAIIGIITFILTIFQFVIGLFGAAFLRRRLRGRERLNESSHKSSQEQLEYDTWAGEGAWRIIHRTLGAVIVLLGLINITLGVFLSVVQLAVWVVWVILLGIAIIVIVVWEIITCIRQGGLRKGASLKLPERMIEYTIYDTTHKREDPKGTSQTSLRYFEEPSQTTLGSIPRRSVDRIPPLERLTRDTTPYRRGTDSLNGDTIPLVSTQARQRPSRLNDVITSGNLPVYNRPNERDYSISTRKRSGPSENEDAGYYVGYSPEHEQISLPRSTEQQQGEHNLTRVRLQ